MITIAWCPGSNSPASPLVRVAMSFTSALPLLYVSYHFLYHWNHATHAGLLRVILFAVSSTYWQSKRFDVMSRLASGSLGMKPATSIDPSGLSFHSFAASVHS